MAELVSDALADIIGAYGDLDPVTALRLLNRVHRALGSEFRIQTTSALVPLVAGTREYVFSDTWLQCWSADYIYGPTNSTSTLDETSVDQLDTDSKGWRFDGNSFPTQWYLWQNEVGGSVLGFDALPTTSTPQNVISGATNVSPIVITTTTAHGLTDSSPIHVDGVVGNTAANTGQGTFVYAKETGFSPTTFALYADAALTIPIAGNGAYVSGGIVSQFPIVQIEVSLFVPLLSTSSFPSTIKSSRPYVYGVLREWAGIKRGFSEEQSRMNQYESAKDELGIFVERKQARNEPRLNSAWGGSVASIG